MRELCKVLIVDDELLVRQGIKHLLNWELDGFRMVGEAANGKEALALIKELRPHIVLTDIVMPVMDGEELTRMIKHSWPEIEVVVLSSFSEFDYVRSTFQSGVSDYILKPHLETSKLLEVLRKTAAKIASLEAPAKADYQVSISQVLEKYLSGYATNADKLLVKDWFPLPDFYLFGSDEEYEMQGEQSLIESLRALLQGMKAMSIPGYSMTGYPDMKLYLLNVSREERDLVPEKLEVLRPSAEKDGSSIAARWVLSRSFQSLEQIGSVYSDSLLALLRYRFFLPAGTALTHSKLPAAETADVFALQPFMEQVRRLQLDEAFGELREHIRLQSLDYTSDVYEFKSFIGNMIFNVIHLLGSMNYDMKQLDEAKYSYFKAIDDAGHISDIQRIVDDFQEQVQLHLQPPKASAAEHSSMKLLLDYVEQHYSEPITLTSMAGHFHFNPSYLSSFFAGHHHEGFKEHLNRVRINKAADLLRYSDSPISEIGSMVGYGDHSYFCKVFKKSLGLSPTQYRRQHQA
ncbi:DNA-binding response regulator [Paenibacillus sp. J23TS9]|uniref:response regulator transcription factor n=1 Tax=Paenibacillus sp. J23TS9 TaxID=2807193 RepID=UPI001B13DC6F|nr:response regulator transcription factor [Paenibacillus sp. J23TS9]GIP30008.1 DNA-binding response regulator [Paenibacillus sp. J23TS9]